MRERRWFPRAVFFLGGVVSFCCCGAKAEDAGADACLEPANESAQHGDLTAAESKARECLRLTPNSAPVLAYIGMVLLKEERLSEAATYLEKAVGIDGSRAVTRFNLALTEFRLGKLDSAAENLELVLRQQADHGPAAVLLGTILAQKGKCRRAVTLLESVEELAMRQPDSAAGLARCYYMLGRREKARQTLAGMREPGEDPKWLALGAGVALEAHDPETADGLLKNLQSHHFNDPQAAHTAALVLFKAGRFAECRAMLERPIETGRRDPEILDLLAWCLHREGNELEAAKVMQQAIQLEPANSIRYTRFAQMRLEAGNYPEALVSAQTATELRPAEVAAWRVRAAVEIAMSMFKQAANSATKAVDLDSRDPDPLLILGVAQQKLFLYAEARATLEKGRQLFPNHASFAVEYGELLLDPGANWSAADQAAGIALLTHVVEQDPSVFEAHLALGQYLVRTGPAAQAVPHLLAAAKLRPGNARAHLLLASAYRAAGRTEESADEIRLVGRLQSAGIAAESRSDQQRQRAQPVSAEREDQ